MTIAMIDLLAFLLGIVLGIAAVVPSVVLRRDNGMVTVMEYNPPCELPRDGHVYTFSLLEFERRYSYDDIPGYWLKLIQQGTDVSDLLPLES